MKKRNYRAQKVNEIKWEAVDDFRTEYKRSDFGKLVRGKYAARLAAETNVVVLPPNVGALTRSQCRVACGPLSQLWVDFT